MKIKICGVTDPDTAFFTAQAGADLIGIIQYPGSIRYVPPARAAKIAIAAKEGGAIPVAVFVDAESASIEQLGIETVQLYGNIPRLPERFRCIYANHPEMPLRTGEDYLLFDQGQGGSGIPFDWDHFEAPQGIRWFLAGGLTADNVGIAIEKLRPYGVDVSSGVEIRGMKDRGRIVSFIEQVRLYG